MRRLALPERDGDDVGDELRHSVEEPESDATVCDGVKVEPLGASTGPMLGVGRCVPSRDARGEPDAKDGDPDGVARPDATVALGEGESEREPEGDPDAELDRHSDTVGENDPNVLTDADALREALAEPETLRVAAGLDAAGVHVRVLVPAPDAERERDGDGVEDGLDDGLLDRDGERDALAETDSGGEGPTCVGVGALVHERVPVAPPDTERVMDGETVAEGERDGDKDADVEGVSDALDEGLRDAPALDAAGESEGVNDTTPVNEDEVESDAVSDELPEGDSVADGDNEGDPDAEAESVSWPSAHAMSAHARSARSMGAERELMRGGGGGAACSCVQGDDRKIRLVYL